MSSPSSLVLRPWRDASTAPKFLAVLEESDEEIARTRLFLVAVVSGCPEDTMEADLGDLHAWCLEQARLDWAEKVEEARALCRQDPDWPRRSLYAIRDLFEELRTAQGDPPPENVVELSTFLGPPRLAWLEALLAREQAGDEEPGDGA